MNGEREIFSSVQKIPQPEQNSSPNSTVFPEEIDISENILPTFTPDTEQLIHEVFGEFVTFDQRQAVATAIFTDTSEQVGILLGTDFHNALRDTTQAHLFSTLHMGLGNNTYMMRIIEYRGLSEYYPIYFDHAKAENAILQVKNRLASSKPAVATSYDNDEDISKKQALFMSLWEQCGNLAYTVASRITQNTQDAQDVSQNVAKILWEQVHNESDIKNIKGWIRKVAQRESFHILSDSERKHIASFYSFEDFEELFISDDISNSPELVTQMSEIERKIDEAIKQLPDRYREVVLLRFKSQLTYEAIEKEYHIPHETAHRLITEVKPLLYRILIEREIL